MNVMILFIYYLVFSRWIENYKILTNFTAKIQQHARLYKPMPSLQPMAQQKCASGQSLELPDLIRAFWAPIRISFILWDSVAHSGQLNARAPGGR